MNAYTARDANMTKRVFFLTDEWTALRRFVRREVSFPEGMPSVYLPWVAYKKRGYDVHVLMIGRFRRRDMLLFEECTIHLLPRSWLSRAVSRLLGRQLGEPVKLASDNLRLYRDATRIGRCLPPTVVYTLRPREVWAAWLLGRRYRCCTVKRIFGSFLHSELFCGSRERSKIVHVLEKKGWQWPASMTIITNDGTSGDEVARLLGIKRECCRFWLNGIDKAWVALPDMSDMLRKETGLLPEHFVLLCLSRLDSWKRQDRAIRAMKIIVNEVPHARLVLAGDGPSREALSQLTEQLGLGTFVKFMGMVPHNKVRNVMAGADVFLQVNDYSNLGNTLLEAMVCGRAIVTWNVGGTDQVITDRDNGCLLPDPEPSTIAHAVIDLARRPEEVTRLGRNARAFAEKNLQTWDERLNMEIDLIESLHPWQEEDGQGIIGSC